MNKLKKVAAGAAAMAVATASTMGVAFANGSVIPNNFTKIGNLDIATFVSTLITLIFIIAGVLALIYLIWGGIKWIMSGGDKAATQNAREQITAAIIGLVVVFLSFAIIRVIGIFFKVDIFNLTIPSI